MAKIVEQYIMLEQDYLFPSALFEIVEDESEEL